MTRHFSIPTALRMTPMPLLRNFFVRVGHEMRNSVWEQFSNRNVRPILEAIQQLEPAQRNSVEAALHDIFDLACEAGVRAIHEAAVSAELTGFAFSSPEPGSPYGISVWTWLYYPTVFERAMLLFEVDHLSRWRKRTDVPRMTPCTSPRVVLQLGEAIGELLRREEGRGQQCTVEHVRRKDATDYFLAYPDDFLDTILAHDEEGALTPQSVRPTFEIVFAYSQADGTLELNAKIPSRLKPELEDIFCQIVLGQPAENCGPEAVYDLNVLKDGPQRLDTDPEDRVTPVVRRLRLAIPESRATITLEADRSAGPQSIYRMLDEYLNRERLPLSDLDVTSATIGLMLHPTNCRKAGRLTFDVSRPDTCTLRSHRPDQVALAQKYLKRWGIAVV